MFQVGLLGEAKPLGDHVIPNLTPHTHTPGHGEEQQRQGLYQGPHSSEAERQGAMETLIWFSESVSPSIHCVWFRKSLPSIS